MSIGFSKDGTFAVHQRADGRIPAAIAIYSTRQDPARPGVQVYKVDVEFAFALNQDEANGIGMRLAAEKSPSTEGWQPPAIAIRWITAGEAEEIASAVNDNPPTPSA